MMQHRENCMLVVKQDEDEELLGIFTTKDLAFRVVGTRLNIYETTVDKIMTVNPMCAKESTLANDALQLMIIKKFRHLPIINYQNQIIGVLDITKCYQLAMNRLETLYENFNGFNDTMDMVVNKTSKRYIHSYFENLKKLINGPRLNELLNNEITIPFYCSQNANIYEVSKMMKLHKTTAILVKKDGDEDEEDESILGIFTSKDIVSRVISKGLDPGVIKVGDVMTMKLATGSSSMSINKALKQMFDGKYLNLPVVDDGNGEIIGVVDIIRLVNYTLNQIQTMESLNEGEGDDEGEGDEGDDDDEFMNDDDELDDIAVGDVSVDELSQFNMSTHTIVPKKSHKRGLHYDEVCNFKFKISKGKFHRISYKPSNGVEKFKEILRQDLNEEEIEYFENSGLDFEICYIDEDNDLVVINKDEELKECVTIMNQLGLDKIDIMLMNKNGMISKRGRLNERKDKGGSSGGGSNLLLPLAMFTLSATIIGVFIISQKR